MILLGVTGCDDQLLPPEPASGGTGRELLVYLNDLTQSDSSGDIDLSRTTIVAKRADGTARRAITTGLIASSPQNGRIAYYYEDSTGVRPSGIYVANDDGSSVALFEPFDNRYGGGIGPWSVTLGPDGASVAWVQADATGSASLVIRTPQHRWTVPLGIVADNPMSLSIPRFSPDGSLVAYAAPDMGRFDGGAVIKLVQTASGLERDIDVQIMAWSGMLAPPFDWAPDSRRILYAGLVIDDSAGVSSELMVTGVETGVTDTLTHDRMIRESPRWLPGGNQICYLQWTESAGSDLYLRDATGTSRRLTNDETTYKVGLSISPDGRTALYTEFVSVDDIFGTIRSFDLVRRTAGPVLATGTDLGHWRK